MIVESTKVFTVTMKNEGCASFLTVNTVKSGGFLRWYNFCVFRALIAALSQNLCHNLTSI